VQLAFPFHVTRRGREAHTTADGHIRDMIEQVLFTAPGERVNRPDFGCGLLRMTFAASNEAVDAATQALVAGSLQQWLGHLIQIEAVEVNSQNETLRVTVRYYARRTQESRVEQFVR
jgi:phage baseplate assembly protein W